jgi:hypothetical protein
MFYKNKNDNNPNNNSGGDVSFDSKLTIKYLNLPKILDDIKFLEFLIGLDSSHPLFVNGVIESILIYKWDKYAGKIFYQDAFTQFLFLILFMINMIYILPEKTLLIK